MKQGKIILLDGVSSAGKSSICKELVQILGSSYQIIAIDDFVKDVFAEQEKHPVSPSEFIARCDECSDKMYEKIKEITDQGKNVICDNVLAGLEGEKSVKLNLEKLKDLNTYFVLVYCPFKILVERILQRNKRARKEDNFQETRSLALALNQFAASFKKQKKDKDIFLEKLSREDFIKALFDAKNEFKNDEKRFEDFKAKALKNIGFEKENTVNLTSFLSYDCIIDTSKCSSKECAQLIIMKLDEELQ